MLLLQGLQAVDALHEIGILHRDIKPDNLLISSSGDLLLIDYDISCLQSEPQTCLVGSDRYRSPRVSASAPVWTYGDDLLSLGLSFAELLDMYQLPDASSAAKWEVLQDLMQHSSFGQTQLASRITEITAEVQHQAA